MGWLRLDSRKSRDELGVQPIWGIDEAVKRTITWYRNQAQGSSPLALCKRDIKDYEEGLKKKMHKNSLISYYLIFFLIFFQGLMGWYMVKSGLSERTDVSHYRLSLHLTLAFFIFVLLLWKYLKYKTHQNFPPQSHEY